jgi:hypothetical protein
LRYALNKLQAPVGADAVGPAPGEPAATEVAYPDRDAVPCDADVEVEGRACLPHADRDQLTGDELDVAHDVLE